MAVSLDSEEDTFSRFGRVVGRSTANDLQDVKAPWNETGQSSTSTTLRDLSDRTMLSPSRFSPSEASAICQGAMAEFSVDTVMVVVVRNTLGVVVGRLQWEAEEPPHQVVFTLLQIKPRYSIVCDVLEGPEFFGRVCWKLRSVSGCVGADPGCIGKGDVLVLEGPRWATQRMLLHGAPKVDTKADAEGMAAAASSAISSLKADFSDLAPTDDSRPQARGVAHFAEAHEWDEAEGPQRMHKESRTKTPATRIPPTVPRLSLSKINEPRYTARCDDPQCRVAHLDAVFCKDVTVSGCRPGAGLEQCSIM